MKHRRRVPVEQKSDKKSFNILIIVAVAVGAFVFLGLLGWRAYQVINVYSIETGVLPGADSFSTLTRERITGDDKTIIAVFEFEKQGDTTLVQALSIIDVGHWGLLLPVDASIMVDQNLSVEVGKLYYAGERLSNQTTGLEFLVTELEKTASVKIDGYIALDLSECDFAAEACSLHEVFSSIEPARVWLSPTRAKRALQRISSNCDLVALQSVLKLNYSQSSDSVSKTVSLDLLDKTTLQGEQVYFLKPSVIEDLIQSFPVPTESMIEQARVEVYNGTDYAGLAGAKAKVFRNSGINVTRTEDAPLTLEETTIFIKDYESYANTVATIKHDLGGNAIVLQAEPNFLTAGDVVVVMGYDSIQL